MIKKIIKKVLKALPPKNYIIFESVPDVSDNAKAVFDEILLRGMNKKYKCIWIVYDKNKVRQKYKNVIYVDNQTRWHNISYIWYTHRAKCIICGNRFITPFSKRQTAFFLTHGTPLKDSSDYYLLPKEIQYCLSAAPGVEALSIHALKTEKEKMFSLGFPRNDVLTKEPIDVKQLLKTSCKKVIVWYPTFRQHAGCKNLTDSSHALPIIHDGEKAEKLNSFAAESDVLIVLKPHFAQDLSYVKNLQLSNIRFINDMFFEENHITSYEFVAGCDAMISDYSSIYYDYTLCDKPIGLIWEDIEEYKKNPGLIKEYEYYLKGGVKIYTLSELCSFIQDVSMDIDALKTERNMIKHITNYSSDGKNSERVLNFIIEKANL